MLTVAALAFTYSRNAWLGLAAGALGLVLTAQRTLRIVAVLAAVLALGAVALPGAGRRAGCDPSSTSRIRPCATGWRCGGRVSP